jgi:hypothetical protein
MSSSNDSASKLPLRSSCKAKPGLRKKKRSVACCFKFALLAIVVFFLVKSLSLACFFFFSFVSGATTLKIRNTKYPKTRDRFPYSSHQYIVFHGFHFLLTLWCFETADNCLNGPFFFFFFFFVKTNNGEGAQATHAAAALCDGLCPLGVGRAAPRRERAVVYGS